MSNQGNHTPGPWIIGTDPRYPSEPCVDAVVDGVVWHIALCHMSVLNFASLPA